MVARSTRRSFDRAVSQIIGGLARKIHEGLAGADQTVVIV
jgi:hypothetical protein